ncbi:MAG TPA: hypothetical protein VJS43_09505 [Candidatus Acidoferrales bacterium]|nr:hypothetical protein [Candidatus Acidoferrales bacterium]
MGNEISPVFTIQVVGGASRNAPADQRASRQAANLLVYASHAAESRKPALHPPKKAAKKSPFFFSISIGTLVESAGVKYISNREISIRNLSLFGWLFVPFRAGPADRDAISAHETLCPSVSSYIQNPRRSLPHMDSKFKSKIGSSTWEIKEAGVLACDNLGAKPP